MKLRTRLSVLLVAIATLFAVNAVTTTVAASAAEVGPFKVMNYNSGLCMDVAHKSTSNGATLHQWTCHGQAHQLWHFITQPSGSGRFLMVPHHVYTRNPQGCVTIPNWSQVVGEDAQVRDCFPAPWAATHQGWSLVPVGGSAFPTPGPQFRYRFINWYSGMCLEIDGGSDAKGARVQQAPCDGSAQQFWIVTT